MKFTTIILLGAALAAGCHPLKAYVQTDMDLAVRGPVCTRLEGNMTAALDEGPLVEVAMGAANCPQSCCKVAVIELDGLLVNYNPVGPYSAGENPVAVFKEKLDAAACDPSVKAVVLRINTPGGGVAASDLIRHTLTAFRQETGKPVVACLLDLGTGGGYYIACGCDAIVAIPSAIVGGIGVLLNLYYAEVAMEQANIFSSSVKAGERIDMGTAERKLTDEEKKLFSSMARAFHDAFKQAVLSARPGVKPDAPCLDGRIMTAQQAVQDGLIDSTGYLGDAIALAAQLARAPAACPVMYSRKAHPPRSLLATTSNRPVNGTTFPYSIPGLDRSRLPLFLYMWQPEPTMLRLTGN